MLIKLSKLSTSYMASPESGTSHSITDSNCISLKKKKNAESNVQKSTVTCELPVTWDE